VGHGSRRFRDAFVRRDSFDLVSPQSEFTNAARSAFSCSERFRLKQVTWKLTTSSSVAAEPLWKYGARPARFTEPVPCTSFGVFRIVEENCQFYAAMPALREIRGARVPRIQVGSCVIGWEQCQRAEEVHQVESISLVS